MDRPSQNRNRSARRVERAKLLREIFSFALGLSTVFGGAYWFLASHAKVPSSPDPPDPIVEKEPERKGFYVVLEGAPPVETPAQTHLTKAQSLSLTEHLAAFDKRVEAYIAKHPAKVKAWREKAEDSFRFAEANGHLKMLKEVCAKTKRPFAESAEGAIRESSFGQVLTTKKSSAKGMDQFLEGSFLYRFCIDSEKALRALRALDKSKTGLAEKTIEEFAALAKLVDFDESASVYRFAKGGDVKKIKQRVWALRGGDLRDGAGGCVVSAVMANYYRQAMLDKKAVFQKSDLGKAAAEQGIDLASRIVSAPDTMYQFGPTGGTDLISALIYTPDDPLIDVAEKSLPDSVPKNERRAAAADKLERNGVSAAEMTKSVAGYLVEREARSRLTRGWVVAFEADPSLYRIPAPAAQAAKEAIKPATKEIAAPEARKVFSQQAAHVVAQKNKQLAQAGEPFRLVLDKGASQKKGGKAPVPR